MKVRRQETLDAMDNEQLKHKRSDIVGCISSAGSIESKEGYESQLQYLDRLLSSKQQLLINLKKNETNE